MANLKKIKRIEIASGSRSRSVWYLFKKLKSAVIASTKFQKWWSSFDPEDSIQPLKLFPVAVATDGKDGPGLKLF